MQEVGHISILRLTQLVLPDSKRLTLTTICLTTFKMCTVPDGMYHEESTNKMETINQKSTQTKQKMKETLKYFV